MPPDGEGVDDVQSMARAALSFVTIGEIRRRIVDFASAGTTTDRTGELRSDELRAVLRLFDGHGNASEADTGASENADADESETDADESETHGDAFAASTNRELRDAVAARAGVETTPSRSFRKEELAEVLLALYRRSGSESGGPRDG